MRLLHVVRERGGGIGRYLSILEALGEEVWEVEGGGPPPKGYDALIVHGVVPEVADYPAPKVYYFHGLRAVSPRILYGRWEFNLLNLWRLRRFKRYLKGFSAFLFPTEAMRGTARRIYGVEGEVLPLPFPQGVKPVEVVPKGRLLLWVGRGAWIKGYDTLLSIAGRLPQWRFKVVGIEKGRGVPPNVEVLGRVPTGALGELYGEATFTLITSRYESFSYVALESMAVGTPVLVLRRAEGAAEMVRRIGPGRVFGTDDEMVRYLRTYSGERFVGRGSGSLLSPERHLKALHSIAEGLMGGPPTGGGNLS